MICDSCGAAVRAVCGELGLAGAHDLVCDSCGWEFYVPAETTARSRIAALREIARDHAARRVDGYLVDVITAGLLVKVYEALSPAQRERFSKPSLPALVDLGWKCVKTP